MLRDHTFQKTYIDNCLNNKHFLELCHTFKAKKKKITFASIYISFTDITVYNNIVASAV